MYQKEGNLKWYEHIKNVWAPITQKSYFLLCDTDVHEWYWTSYPQYKKRYPFSICIHCNK